ncbi:MAG: hypothetical protein ACE5D6_07990, partial [Candidatus Zixiibacteriota bacterium]
FPGSPKDMFTSDAEKEKLVDEVRAKRSQGEVIRENCTLLEARISFFDQIVLTVASVVLFISLFLPWYSVYNEIVEKTARTTDETALIADSMLVAGNDSLVQEVSDSGVAVAQVSEGTPEASEPEEAVKKSSAEEIIHGYVAKKKIHKEYSRLSGIASFVSIGSIGSYVFSSGGVLIITALLLLIYALSCIGLPAYTLFGIYGIKGNPDDKALKLKKILRLNWIPVMLFVIATMLSFFGADYGFNAPDFFTSIGNSYGPGVFLNTISWGIIISMGASMLVAAKGIEI